MTLRSSTDRKFSLSARSSAFACLGVFLIGVLLLSGCATVQVEEEKVSEAPAAAEAKPKTEAPKTGLQPPASIKEETLEAQPFKVEELSVREEQGQTTLRMKFSQPVTQYRYFSLLLPSRIVLDVYGDTKRLARVENFRADTHWVDTLRLSSSEGYLRLVMEITAANIPPYVVEPEDGGVKVTIGAVNPALTARKDLQLVQGGKRADVKVAEAKPVAPEAAPAPPAVPGAPPAVPGEKKYTGQRISLDFKDADIKNVFRLLAEVSGLNIVVTDDVVRRVTLRLVDVPWDQALNLLIETNGLGKEQIGNVVRISTADRLKREKDSLLAARKAEENLEPLQTGYLSVNYAKVKELLDKIKPALSARGVVVSDDRSNTIIVRDIRKGIEEANAIVSRLDTRTPQVLIESNLIETTPTFARALGLDLQFDARIHNNPDRRAELRSKFPAGSPFATDSGTFGIIQDRLGVLRDIKSILSAAEKEGNIRIISRPSVVTLNNVASTIQSLRVLRVGLPTGTSSTAVGTGAAAGVSVATERVPVGIILTVTPQVSSDGFVLMNINVKSSSIAESPTVSGGTANVLPFDELTREATANVLVRDGETIVIGGIMKDTRLTSESGIPFLKDIPLVGWLFKNVRWQKDFEELMVFITPRIVAAGAENLPSAEQLWREQMRKTEGG